MKTIKTSYNKHGWRFIVSKNKDDIIHIYLRSKTGVHKIHKPFYLRLQDDDLLRLLNALMKLEGHSLNNACAKSGGKD
jgi:hypothetical protein